MQSTRSSSTPAIPGRDHLTLETTPIYGIVETMPIASLEDIMDDRLDPTGDSLDGCGDL